MCWLMRGGKTPADRVATCGTLGDAIVMIQAAMAAGKQLQRDESERAKK